MTTKKFTTKPRNVAVIEFDIDDDTYHFTPPKLAPTMVALVQSGGGMEMDLTAARSILNWLSDGLPEEENAKIVARLQDPADDFDIDSLGPIFQYLMPQVTGRPTKPRSAS